MQGWLALGASSSPWVHALASGAIAAVASFLFSSTWLGFLFVGLAGVGIGGVLAVGGMFFAFALIARPFVRRGATWFGLTVLPWAAVTVLATVASSVDYGTFSPWPALLGGAVGAGCALLGHAGPARVAGILLAVAVTVALPPLWMDGRMQAAQALYESTVRPYVTDVDGFYSWLEPERSDSGPEAFSAQYYRGEWGYDAPMDPGFVLTTERVGNPDHREPEPCATLLYPTVGQFAEEATTCREVDGRWIREGATSHEVFMIVDDLVVRATSPIDIPLEALHSALDTAKPMDDAHYRHLLLGPEAGCLPEIDCPSDEP